MVTPYGKQGLNESADPGAPEVDKRTRTFEEVILCHLNTVYRMAMKLTGNRHEAEDLVQETFLRAHEAYSSFELREYGARPWLFRILLNVFYAQCGEARRAPTLLQDLSVDDVAGELQLPRPEIFSAEDVDWDKYDEELKEAVLSLPPKNRVVIVLWALGGLTYEEVAKALDCSLGTVMSRLFRARQKLSEVLHEFAMERGILPRQEVGQ